MHNAILTQQTPYSEKEVNNLSQRNNKEKIVT
jgi:hypothetical protein